jgi:hypothetical protein
MGDDHRGAFLFPGGKRDKPLSNMAMLALLERMGRKDRPLTAFAQPSGTGPLSGPISPMKWSK